MSDRAGGLGRMDIFRVKQDHSAVQQKDGTTPAAADTDAILRLGFDTDDFLIQTDFTPNDDGSIGFKLNQTKFDKAYDDFMKIACPRKASAASTSRNEITDERGRKKGGSSGTGTEEQFLVKSYSAEGSDGNIIVTNSIGYFKKTSGGYSYKNADTVAPGLEFVSVAAKQAVTIKKELNDAALVTQAAADLTYDKDYHCVNEFLVPA
jgi:hypothetical protein